METVCRLFNSTLFVVKLASSHWIGANRCSSLCPSERNQWAQSLALHVSSSETDWSEEESVNHTHRKQRDTEVRIRSFSNLSLNINTTGMVWYRGPVTSSLCGFQLCTVGRKWALISAHYKKHLMLFVFPRFHINACVRIYSVILEIISLDQCHEIMFFHTYWCITINTILHHVFLNVQRNLTRCLLFCYFPNYESKTNDQ